jgi:hypothetical protein
MNAVVIVMEGGIFAQSLKMSSKPTALAFEFVRTNIVGALEVVLGIYIWQWLHMCHRSSIFCWGTGSGSMGVAWEMVGGSASDRLRTIWLLLR